jgi:hypothetical protein
LLAHRSGAAGHWRMLAVDTDGFDLVQDETLYRIAFDRPVANAEEVRAALLRMLQAARHTRW